MIISRTPMRVSFIGGGSDLAAFYRRNGGAVLSMSIQKYFYLSMHDYFNDDGYLLKYSSVERRSKIDEIEHRIIKQVFKDYQINSIDFSSAADIPAGTGLGSSSSFTVSLITLCNALTGKYESNMRIAEKACEVEIEKLGEPIGKQDQYACAIGGMNLIQFHEDHTVSIDPIFLSMKERARLDSNLMLFYLNKTRSASKILNHQNKLSASNDAVIKDLKDMASMARELAREVLSDVDVIGDYLNESWKRKRRLSPKISDPTIDKYYRIGMSAGARGGKLLGAGGGGFLMFYVTEDRQVEVQSALAELSCHRVKMDTTGTTIVFDDRVI